MRSRSCESLPGPTGLLYTCDHILCMTMYRAYITNVSLSDSNWWRNTSFINLKCNTFPPGVDGESRPRIRARWAELGRSMLSAINNRFYLFFGSLLIVFIVLSNEKSDRIGLTNAAQALRGMLMIGASRKMHMTGMISWASKIHCV